MRKKEGKIEKKNRTKEINCSTSIRQLSVVDIIVTTVTYIDQTGLFQLYFNFTDMKIGMHIN